eukprot:TRINITY_DN1439_c0_g1_i1.p1 TRINITY_DN1439_c0_g1~~TRINITY_DN1439_c0_g1_i1.p1  ORF type:complete len:377 (+),score=157.26 TRINITY_DN1439_c0_g1_i1:102-1133(+)
MDIKARISQVQQEVDSLKQRIRSAKEAARDGQLLNDKASGLPQQSLKLKGIRTLRGHSQKVYAMQWCPDPSSNLLISAGQDGVILVWDALTATKTFGVPLGCLWLMTCSLSPSGNFAATGGLDNNISIFKTSELTATPARVLSNHTAHISCVRFLNNQHILSSSGDKTCRYWDIEANKVVTKFDQHHGAVLSLAVSPDGNTFVSSSADQTAKVFDIRAGNMTQISLTGHTGDIEATAFFPGGTAIATGSEDRTAKLYDIRAGQEMITYQVNAPVFSLDFSKTGRYLFIAKEDSTNAAAVWDAMRGEEISTLKGHKDFIGGIGVSGDGLAVATSSWDNMLKVWS